MIWQLNLKRGVWRPVWLYVLMAPVLCMKTGCHLALCVAPFFICLCLALGTVETDGEGCKISLLLSKEQVKEAVKRVDVMQQSNFASALFLS